MVYYPRTEQARIYDAKVNEAVGWFPVSDSYIYEVADPNSELRPLLDALRRLRTHKKYFVKTGYYSFGCSGFEWSLDKVVNRDIDGRHLAEFLDFQREGVSKIRFYL